MPDPLTLAIAAACLAAGSLLGFAAAAWRGRRVAREQAARLDRALSEARTDELTGLWNRKALDEYMALQTAIARRYGVPFSLLLIDVDHFKAINDAHGHPAGDAALRELAGVLKACARESDLVARYGGEEFAILLTQTDCSGGLALADRIRTRLETLPIAAPQTELRLRVSAGMATLQPAESSESLVSRADRALYASKQAGRNRIHMHDGETLVDVTLAPKLPGPTARVPGVER